KIQASLSFAKNPPLAYTLYLRHRLASYKFVAKLNQPMVKIRLQLLVIHTIAQYASLLVY
ncbi:MAG: hypothetical protein ACI96W_002145, partial [Paraglaciecola sp.]